MIYSGKAAIDYLGQEICKDDSGASSYWRKYHDSFRFTGDGFEGLRAFGNRDRPYQGLRLAIHRLLQHRIRRMGAAFPQFEACDRIAADIVARQQRGHDGDVLRHSLTLAFLQYHAPGALSSKAMACVIGDGFALMTSLLLVSRSAGRVILINLTKTLLVDLWYLNLWMGEEAFDSCVDLVTDEAGLHLALAKPTTNEFGDRRVIAIQASDHELLQLCPVDFALNVASMQEMDPRVIEAYFHDMRTIASSRKFIFYCCNREQKTLPDNTVINFAEYPWHDDDQIIVDELCPWHQFFYVLRPPFYLDFDGPVRHRLVTFP